jgi:hypothetical protein
MKATAPTRRYRPRVSAPPPRSWPRTTLARFRRPYGAEVRVSLARVDGILRLVVGHRAEDATGILKPAGPAELTLEELATVSAALELGRRAMARAEGPAR